MAVANSMAWRRHCAFCLKSWQALGIRSRSFWTVVFGGGAISSKRCAWALERCWLDAHTPTDLAQPGARALRERSKFCALTLFGLLNSSVAHHLASSINPLWTCQR